MLGDVARKLVFLSLSEALLEGIGTLHNVLLVKAQVLVHQVHLGHGPCQLSERLVEVFTPLRILPGRDSLRAEHDLEVLLDVLVVGFEWIVHI